MVDVDLRNHHHHHHHRAAAPDASAAAIGPGPRWSPPWPPGQVERWGGVLGVKP